MRELTDDERRALADYFDLSRDERETLTDLARYLSRADAKEPDRKNLDALLEMLRRRTELFEILSKALFWARLRTFVLRLGAFAGVATAIMAAYSAFKDFGK